ncbi:MAG: WecB/TagA/CpsF family glycosyltransferase [Leptolyngbya sp. SIO3F4]|nr:WecB/TagA/CpsF family glycosyltransferase [Leptolyngbya sp. SIO3F4]
MASVGLVDSSKLPKVDIVGVSVTALVFQEQVAEILTWAKQRSSKFVCVANVHMLMEARYNDALRRALSKADMVTPDGMPLVWVMKRLGLNTQDRVAGMDIFTSICHRSVEEGVSIYLLGSTQEVLKRIQTRLQKEFPTLSIAGSESPPFRPLTQEEDAELVKRINNSGAGITFISLGCPKQECWMDAHCSLVESVMIGVGGVFPVYAGLQRYAPKWIRDMGLEWFFRLIQEPRRLFGRYFKTIPPFIWLAIQQIRREKSNNRQASVIHF